MAFSITRAALRGILFLQPPFGSHAQIHLFFSIQGNNYCNVVVIYAPFTCEEPSRFLGLRNSTSLPLSE